MERVFEIQGPDDNGDVWICSVPGAVETWCHNLGKCEGVAETFSQWLGVIDYQESEARPIAGSPVTKD